MSVDNKQQLSDIWGSIRLKVKQYWGWVKKKEEKKQKKKSVAYK